MNHNVVNSQYAIECYNDTLEIIGTDTCQSSVVFCLTGSSAYELLRECPSFCKNAIFTQGVNSRKNMFIFEYHLNGELRNPRKLLKSVRNKLIQQSFKNQREEDKEYNEMYSVPDRAEHEMFNKP